MKYTHKKFEKDLARKQKKTLIFEMRQNKKTYKEIGKILGVTKQRIHQIYKDYISTPEWIKKEILRRDKKKCAICDLLQINGKPILHIHHINGTKKDNNFENLVTLCQKCHMKIEKVDHKFIKTKDFIKR